MRQEFEKYRSYDNRLNEFMFGPLDKETNEKNDAGLRSIDHSESLDSFMFGGRSSDFPEKSEATHTNSDKINDLMNNIDIFEVMGSIETLVHSAKQLKPLYQKVSPFIEQFIKK